jgi:uncharacterized protein YjbJ (UPF0337 family)
MTAMNENEIKGMGQEAVGHVKDAVGGLTGDTSTQIDGKIDEASGKLKAQFGGVVDDMTSKGSDFAARATSTARDAGEKIYSAGNQAGKYVGETVAQQPLLSLIGAAAIGYLVAFLLHAPSSPLTPTPRKRGYFY